MRKDKLEFTLDVVSGIDEEIVDRHLTKRYKLSQRRGKRINVSLLSAIAAVLCLAILGGAVCMIVFGKQVPVYQGMTVSNQAPAVPASELALPEPMISVMSTSSTLPAYGLEPLAEQETIETEAATEGETAPIIFGKTYYALKDEDIYIHIHLDNPDGFEIVSFTLNGVKYTNYMFEPGSDLETLILKYNVGDVDGLQEYTIDAIKYIDGEAIKDVRMKGDRTVKVYVNDDTQALSFTTETEFNTLRFTPVWDDSFTGEKTIQTLALYEGEELLRELSPTDTEVTDLPMGKRLILVATYIDGGVHQTLRYVFDMPKYSEGLQMTNGVITGMGTCTDSVLYLNAPIGNRAFQGNEIITAVYFGPGVTSIGENAFVQCFGLEKAVFSANPNEMVNGLFWECVNLTSVKLPDGMIKLPAHTFSGCAGLKSITLPESLEYIGVGAFSDCISMESIILPDSLTHIDASAFYGCSSLNNVVIPDSVTRIDGSAFGECNNLKSIKLPDSIEELQSIFYYSTGLAHVEIPESVTVIREFCFTGVSSLESIRIPDSVETIYGYAFHQCESLESIELSGNVRFKADPSRPDEKIWFSYCNKLTTVKLHGTRFYFDFSIFFNNEFIYDPVIIKDVYYDGSMEEFRNCFPGDAYLKEYNPMIHCTDGDFRYS